MKIQPHLIFERVQGTDFLNIFSPAGHGLTVVALFLANKGIVDWPAIALGYRSGDFRHVASDRARRPR